MFICTKKLWLTSGGEIVGVKKSLDLYAADILQLHVELQRLTDYHPDYENTQAKLSRKLTAWTSLLRITISVASNEQTPWTQGEIGYPCVPMATKQDSILRQTGDYQAYLNDYDKFCGLLVERKGTTRKNRRMVGCDLYSSFSNEDNRRRFYAEVERFKQDKRFNQMLLISECSLGEYLSFKPAFNGKQYNKCNYGMNVPSRRATIAKLHAIGCTVHFAGTRHHAIEMYHDFVVQWVRENYVKILNLEE